MSPIPKPVENGFHILADGFFARWPQPRPSPERLRGCKLIAHRGVHDNRRVLENTLAAFDRAVQNRLWGIEFDVRWTRDLQPVVIHDRDCRRVWGRDTIVAQTTLVQLRSQLPGIPTLAETVERYGRRLHLMVEIKSEPYPNPPVQRRVLKALLAPLTPARDFHFLSLDVGMFQGLDFVSPHTCLPIAQLNPGRLSRVTIDRKYGGLTGHYLIIGHGLVSRHLRRGQQVGTGFIASRKCLYRELNRGVDWIFSNQAEQLQHMLNR